MDTMHGATESTSIPKVKDEREYIAELETAINKVCKWLDSLAADAEKQARTCDRFPSLKAACEHDAKNFRATAADLRKHLRSNQ
jgi:hypothetical protein